MIKWLTGLVEKIYKILKTKEQEDYKKNKMTEDDRLRLQAIENLKRLYEFTHWLNNKCFTSRRERKSFWRNVSENSTLVETTIQNVIRQYQVDNKHE